MSLRRTRHHVRHWQLLQVATSVLLLTLVPANAAAQVVSSPPSGPAPQPPAPPLGGVVIPAITHLAPPAPLRDTHAGEERAASTNRLDPSGLAPRTLGFLGPFRRPTVPELFPGSGARLRSLVRDDKLYLTLHDAIALAVENNLDVEIERQNLQLADTDLVRAKGGGSLRGIDFTIEEPPNGVGGPGSPLLALAATGSNPTAPSLTDLTSLNSNTQAQTNLATTTSVESYSPGPTVPLFDPNFILSAGYLRRSDTVSLVSTTGTGAGSTSGTGAGGNGSGAPVITPPLHYIAANAAYLQGFSTGAQLEAIVNNDAQVVYSTTSENDPFYSPSTSVTVTQPLLRGRGRAVSLRFVRIANLNRNVSRLLFEQQVLEVIYGVSRIYFDLVSLGENVAVKQEALRAAEKLRQDDAEQVIQGTLAPIELTRVAALVSSSQFDLAQAQGLYRQEEVILRNLLVRASSPVFNALFSEIVPTDRIIVPDLLELPPVADLITEGLSKRPDIAQSELQIKTGQISVQASRNEALPQLSLYANYQGRGASEAPYEQLGSTGTGLPTIPINLTTGGLRTSTIYQAGVQLTLPLRNRVAASDAARDAIQLRQAEARTEKLDEQIRQDIENAVIALQTAFAAYKAAVASRSYQEQLLETERDRLSVGESTNLNIVQDQSFVAQARSTEIAARSNWAKAQVELDRDIGDLLDKNHVQLEDAIQGALP